MQIPFHKPHITENEINSVVESLKSGWLTMGEKTFEFENNFSEFVHSKYAIGVNSATSALHLALRTIGLKKDDEVIMPAMTFISTAEVVCYFEAVPVFVDIEKDTHNISAEKIESQITHKTKCIIPVHFAGQPCDMDEIIRIADKYNLYIIEDAAHAFPSFYKDKIVGSISDMTCFSFYATKTLTTGEGGMITTYNNEWVDLIKTLRLHGITKDAWNRYSESGSWKYDVHDLGYKYNISDISSSIGIEQLKIANDLQKKREIIAEKYNKAFSDIDELITFKIKNDRISSWHLYPLKLNIDCLSIDRDNFIEELKERGISTSVHFIPLYEFTYYKNLGYKKEDYPNCQWVYNRTLSLPIYPDMSKDEVDYVIKNVVEVVEEHKN